MIAEAKNIDKLLIKNGDTNDIKKTILQVNSENIESDTKAFSKQIEKSIAGLKKLFFFLKKEIKYKEDPNGVQWIKTPARLFSDRVGDCKSLTLFIVSVLKNLKIPYIIRFTSYTEGGDITHVYPVAILGKQEIILDVVWGRFDDEKAYTQKQDYKFDMTKIYKMSGTDKNLSEMTNEEFYNFLGYKVERIAGNNGYLDQKAFPKVGSLKSVVQNAAKKVVQVVQKLSPIDEILELIFKKNIDKIADFFLYTFLTTYVSAKVEAKKAKQNKILNFISLAAGIERQKIDAALRASYLKRYGKTPEQLLNEAAQGKKVAGIGVITLAAAAAATEIIIPIIKKIVSLFPKHKDKIPDVTANDGSNLAEIATESKGETVATEKDNTGRVIITTDPTVPETSGDKILNPPIPDIKPPADDKLPPEPSETAPAKNNNMLLLGAVAVAVFVMMKKK